MSESPEQRAERVLRELLREHHDDMSLLARLGDGEAGYMLSIIHDELNIRRAPRGTPRNKRKIPAALRQAVFERNAYRCQHCGTWEDLTVDHIIPESAGGPTELSNLQTLCRQCNCKKGTKVGP